MPLRVNKLEKLENQRQYFYKYLKHENELFHRPGLLNWIFLPGFSNTRMGNMYALKGDSLMVFPSSETPCETYLA